MQRYFDIVRDQFGNPVGGVSVLVTNASTGTAASLYLASDNASEATHAISNPIVTDATGVVAFAVAVGQYTIQYSGSNFTTITRPWLTLSDTNNISSTPTFTNITLTGTGTSNGIRQSYTAGDTWVFMRVDNANAGRGPNLINGYDPSFSGTRDPVIGISYNQYASGNLVVAGEPGFTFNIEGDYNDGSGQNKIECYMQYVSASGTTTCRPHFVQMNRTTDKIAAHVIKGDAIKFLADDGAAETGSNIGEFQPNTFLLYAPTSTLDTVLRLNAAASHQAYLSLGYNAAQDKLLIAFNGSQNEGVWTQNGRQIAHFFSAPLGGTGACMSIGVQDNNAVGTFDVGSTNVDVKGVVARAKSGSTANMLEVQLSDTTVTLGCTKEGALTVRDSLGFRSGAGALATQTTNRTTSVTLNNSVGAITLVSAAGSTTPTTFTVNNSKVAATDVVILNQKSGTDKYILMVTAVAAGSFNISNWTTGGTTTEQPVINFAVIKGVTA